MKRQIICKECFIRYPLKQYDGEWFKRVNGKLNILDAHCDICYKIIKENEECCAESMGVNGQPYYEWENEYIIKN